ncbi:Tautomerase/MIF [Artomyces pyxidatus]|uniref:Tautomerase/MIF n=1 Tax=Artomyces pyxidatus TaxID=48021 RepID=A0ACB8SUZ6_9AGAM|nr:Tautomerase/MIF [Artomyces pyxidatus]
MPSLTIETNVKVPDPKKFVTTFSKLAATTLNKPESYIAVSYRYNEFLSWEGTFDPAFLLVVTSLDNIAPALNEQYSKAFFAFFEAELAAPGNRGYITFDDPGRGNLGHKSTTFATIFGAK